jgi:hypothetical protein
MRSTLAKGLSQPLGSASHVPICLNVAVNGELDDTIMKRDAIEVGEE